MWGKNTNIRYDHNSSDLEPYVKWNDVTWNHMWAAARLRLCWTSARNPPWLWPTWSYDHITMTKDDSDQCNLVIWSYNNDQGLLWPVHASVCGEDDNDNNYDNDNDDNDSDQSIGSVCWEDDDIYWRRVISNTNPILK